MNLGIPAVFCQQLAKSCAVTRPSRPIPPTFRRTRQHRRSHWTRCGRRQSRRPHRPRRSRRRRRGRRRCRRYRRYRRRRLARPRSCRRPRRSRRRPTGIRRGRRYRHRRRRRVRNSSGRRSQWRAPTAQAISDLARVVIRARAGIAGVDSVKRLTLTQNAGTQPLTFPPHHSAGGPGPARRSRGRILGSTPSRRAHRPHVTRWGMNPGSTWDASAGPARLRRSVISTPRRRPHVVGATGVDNLGPPEPPSQQRGDRRHE